MCKDKVSNTCGNSIYATCVDYEGLLGDNTTITSSCVSQNDVNEDLYAITDSIIENSKTDNLGNSCITYPLTEGKILLKSVLETNEQEICSLKTRVESLESVNYSELDITTWGLTIPTCIADSCNNPPTTLKELIQAIMNNRNCT